MYYPFRQRIDQACFVIINNLYLSLNYKKNPLLSIADSTFVPCLYQMISQIIKSFLLIFCVLLFMNSIRIDAIAIDDYHCKVPTCRDFYYVSSIVICPSMLRWLCSRVWGIYQIMISTKKLVTTPFLHFKQYHESLVNVSMKKLVNWIQSVYVSLKLIVLEKSMS